MNGALLSDRNYTCDQIFLSVGPLAGAKLFVVNFEIATTPARLTSPSVTCQYLKPECFVYVPR